MKALTAVAIAIFAIVIGVACWYTETHTPRSTQGVTEVGDNTVRLPKGDTLIITHATSKNTRDTWEITRDSSQTVRFFADNSFLFWDSVKLHTATLCGVGCTTDVGMGWGGDHMSVTERSDGTVDIRWPYGWNYRAYKG